MIGAGNALWNAAVYRRDRLLHPLLYSRLWCAVHLWALLIPMLARSRNLDCILRGAAPTKRQPFLGLAADTILRCCHTAVRRPLLMADRACLREGLLVYRFATMAGYTPRLVFGIDATSLSANRVDAHCWVELPPDHIVNPPQPGMLAIMIHSSAGSAGASPPSPVADVCS